ncbi:MAG: hypothetical protein KKC79_12875 [Gammaproteobacteria bacterium]|nr:hypothetical protein [Gammaproteobacteria bacterium]MBU1440720.1 hypothetical protein [Gammaproteobacteria bacterium]MBU2287236.1 hypothetical protein [Gammaproteobacteria bacterium]MBU2409524.1 hypothetical protein [Gammaproteobacteria bacterium]
MTNEPIFPMLMLSTIAGAALGAFFFGGLWWSLRRGLGSPRPALWQLGSAIVRTVVVLCGFLVTSAGSWQRMLAGVAGFIVARMLITRWVRRMPERGADAMERARHAPRP